MQPLLRTLVLVETTAPMRSAPVNLNIYVLSVYCTADLGWHGRASTSTRPLQFNPLASMASVTSKPAAAATNDGDETKDTTVLRVTETPNAMTMDVDVVGPHGAVRCLRQADAQMFAGWKSYPGACSRLSMHNLQL